MQSVAGLINVQPVPDRWRLAECAWAALGLLLVVTVALISAQTLITLLFALVLSQLVAAMLLERNERVHVARSLLVYSSVVVLLYLLQRAALPEYYGFSGPPWIGTDDSYFFSLGSPDLPADFPVREGYFLREDTYGAFLRLFGDSLYRFYGSVHPLDLTLMNASLVALLPSMVARTVQVLDSEAAADFARRASLWCPFLLANSTVLVRDGLIATAYAIAIYAVLRRRYFLTVLCVGFAAYLRLQHGLLLAGILWLVATALWATERAGSEALGRKAMRSLLALWTVPALLAGAALFLVLQTDIAGVLLSNSFFRQDFLQTFIVEGAARDSGSSTFYQINQLPWVARLPLALAFYFVSPLIDLTRLLNASLFVPRDYMFALFGLLMVGYAALFARGAVRAFAERRFVLIALIVGYGISLLAVSQGSMQLRHKVPLLVLFYIVTAVGFARHADKRVQTAAIFLAFLLGSVQIFFNAVKFA
jgi:hypothetical protein